MKKARNAGQGLWGGFGISLVCVRGHRLQPNHLDLIAMSPGWSRRRRWTLASWRARSFSRQFTISSSGGATGKRRGAMKRNFLLIFVGFVVEPSTAQCQQISCLYQTALVMRDRAWCIANGQAWLDVSDPSKLSHGESVKALQMLLVAAGYNPGPIDGAHGPLTTAAITEHQRRFGLPLGGDYETFIPSLVTQATLRTDALIKAFAASQVSTSQSTARENRIGEVQAASRVGTLVALSAVEHAGPALKGLGVLLVGGVIALWAAFRKR